MAGLDPWRVSQWNAAGAAQLNFIVYPESTLLDAPWCGADQLKFSAWPRIPEGVFSAPLALWWLSGSCRVNMPEQVRLDTMRCERLKPKGKLRVPVLRASAGNTDVPRRQEKETCESP